MNIFDYHNLDNRCVIYTSWDLHQYKLLSYRLCNNVCENEINISSYFHGLLILNKVHEMSSLSNKKYIIYGIMCQVIADSIRNINECDILSYQGDNINIDEICEVINDIVCKVGCQLIMPCVCDYTSDPDQLEVLKLLSINCIFFSYPQYQLVDGVQALLSGNPHNLSFLIYSTCIKNYDKIVDKKYFTTGYNLIKDLTPNQMIIPIPKYYINECNQSNMLLEMPYTSNEIFTNNATTVVYNNDIAIKSQSNYCAHETIKEIAILSYLSHVNVIDIKQVLFTTDIINFSMEYIPITLIDLMYDYIIPHAIIENQPLCNIPRDIIITIIDGISEGVKYIHSMGIIHGDLKLTNILISDGNVPKIIDFGLSQVFGNKPMVVGTYNYAPYDILIQWDTRQDNRYNFTYHYDIWSVGVMLLDMVLGYVSLISIQSEVNDIIKDVCKKIEDLIISDKLECVTDQLFRNKLLGMLNINPLDRIL